MLASLLWILIFTFCLFLIPHLLSNYLWLTFDFLKLPCSWLQKTKQNPTDGKHLVPFTMDLCNIYVNCVGHQILHVAVGNTVQPFTVLCMNCATKLQRKKKVVGCGVFFMNSLTIIMPQLYCIWKKAWASRILCRYHQLYYFFC